MRNIIQFHIFKGENKYVAEGIDIPVVTQADTLDELTMNIKEATDLFLENEELSEFGIEENPSVLVNFELPKKIYA